VGVVFIIKIVIMKKVVKLSESDLTRIIENIINEQDNELPRKVYDHRITRDKLQSYRDNGLMLYYFNPNEGRDFGLIEFKAPLSAFEIRNNPKYVYALTQDEYNKVNQVVMNIQEMSETYREQIKLYKQLVYVMMDKIVEK
jgi:hypothetical protein